MAGLRCFLPPRPCLIVRQRRAADFIAMAQDIDPFKLSSPRIFLVRMSVFLILCALVVVVALQADLDCVSRQSRAQTP